MPLAHRPMSNVFYVYVSSICAFIYICLWLTRQCLMSIMNVSSILVYIYMPLAHRPMSNVGYVCVWYLCIYIYVCVCVCVPLAHQTMSNVYYVFVWYLCIYIYIYIYAFGSPNNV